MNGAELRAHRKTLGLTQAELAIRIGMSRIMIGMMERGECEVAPRTQAAVLAVLPRPLERTPTRHEQLVRDLETALITARLHYTADKQFGDRRVDFYLDDLRIGLYVETGRHMARRDLTTEVDTIALSGKAAVEAFTTLLRHAGVHMLRRAGRDPYAREDDIL